MQFAFCIEYLLQRCKGSKRIPKVGKQSLKLRHFIFNSKHQHILLILVMLSHVNLLYLNKNNYSPDKIAIYVAVLKAIIQLKMSIQQCIYSHLPVKNEFTS